MTAWATNVAAGDHERRDDGNLVAFVIDEGGQFGWSIHEKGVGHATKFLRGGKAADRAGARDAADRMIGLHRDLESAIAAEDFDRVLDVCERINEETKR